MTAADTDKIHRQKKRRTKDRFTLTFLILNTGIHAVPNDSSRALTRPMPPHESFPKWLQSVPLSFQPLPCCRALDGRGFELQAC
mmetsp:Transcript_32854/g.59510  ORF Transcript_32854/g.59510 Transcript_32854/m.59510 type:complete len:84 (+) Transcript_32854:60-311(+)